MVGKNKRIKKKLIPSSKDMLKYLKQYAFYEHMRSSNKDELYSRHYHDRIRLGLVCSVKIILLT